MSKQPFRPPQRVAYALAVFPLDVIARSTLRAIYPQGVTIRQSRTKKKNTATVQYQRLLAEFEGNGWIVRSEHHVEIAREGRPALMEYATQYTEFLPLHRVLDLNAVLNAAARPVVDTDEAWAQSEREVRAIRQLVMAPVTGERWGGRGSVARVGPAGSGD